MCIVVDSNCHQIWKLLHDNAEFGFKVKRVCFYNREDQSHDTRNFMSPLIFCSDLLELNLESDKMDLYLEVVNCQDTNLTRLQQLQVTTTRESRAYRLTSMYTSVNFKFRTTLASLVLEYPKKKMVMLFQHMED
jgi:hypothetical protein